MSEFISSFKGMGGKIELYEDKLVITKGLLFGRNQKTIFLSQLSGVVMKKAGMSSPAIHFALADSAIQKRNSKDDNTIKFSNNVKKKAYAFRDSVELQMSKYNAKSNVNESTVSSADELMKFKSLLDQGAITQEEFEMKKKQLL